MKSVGVVVVILMATTCVVATGGKGFPDPVPPVPGFKTRDTLSRTGSQWVKEVLKVDPVACAKSKACGFGIPADVKREIAFLKEFFEGNMPTWFNELSPIIMTGKAGTISAGIECRVWTTQDVLGVGSHDDWFRMPLSPYAGRFIADQYEMSLPTKAMVQASFAQAKYVVYSNPLGANAAQTGAGYSYYASEWVKRQLDTKGVVGGTGLVAGHRKIPIISTYSSLAANAKKLDFYGFYKSATSKVAWQTNPAHEASYADYSHGIQLVHQRVDVLENGGNTYRQANLFDLLKEPKYANILNAGDVYSPATKKGSFDAANCYSYCAADRLAAKKCVAAQNATWLKTMRDAFPGKK